MGWTHITDIDSTAGTSDDNPFAGPKLQIPGKVSVQLPTDRWLCRKLATLNLALTDGYPFRSAEAGGLQRDQFLKPPRSQAKWYGFHSRQKSDTTETVTSWNTVHIPEDSKTGWNHHKPSQVVPYLTGNVEEMGENRQGVVGYL